MRRHRDATGGGPSCKTKLNNMKKRTLNLLTQEAVHRLDKTADVPLDTAEARPKLQTGPFVSSVGPYASSASPAAYQLSSNDHNDKKQEVIYIMPATPRSTFVSTYLSWIDCYKNVNLLRTACIILQDKSS